MTIITIFGQKLKFLLNERADQLSFSTGFIKRRRKVTGSSFAKALIIGNMGRESSLEGMCELFSQDEITLTKQGIDFRFTQEGVNFMRALYEEGSVACVREGCTFDQNRRIPDIATPLGLQNC
jgi:hypothetical protein